MKNIVKNILVPVELDVPHLSLAKQAAEFARHHEASIHLLHIAHRPLTLHRLFKNATYHNQLYKETNEKVAQLNTWKRWLELEYGITVRIDVDWGNSNKLIVRYARSVGADMIILKQDTVLRNRFSWIPDALVHTLHHYEGQVVTLTATNNGIADWRQVVIPVTDFIPEKRIRTIIEIARTYHLKIHLVTASHDSVTRTQPEFYFLTETLKRFKSSGNISVECRCLPVTGNKISSYINYARSIKADVLMTYLPTKEHDLIHKPSLYIASKNQMIQLS